VTPGWPCVVWQVLVRQECRCRAGYEGREYDEAALEIREGALVQPEDLPQRLAIAGAPENDRLVTESVQREQGIAQLLHRGRRDLETAPPMAAELTVANSARPAGARRLPSNKND